MRAVQRSWAATPVRFVDEVIAGDAALDHPAEELVGVLIDDRHDLDGRPSVVTSNWKSHRPRPIAGLGHAKAIEPLCD